MIELPLPGYEQLEKSASDTMDQGMTHTCIRFEALITQLLGPSTALIETDILGQETHLMEMPYWATAS